MTVKARPPPPAPQVNEPEMRTVDTLIRKLLVWVARRMSREVCGVSGWQVGWVDGKEDEWRGRWGARMTSGMSGW